MVIDEGCCRRKVGAHLLFHHGTAPNRIESTQKKKENIGPKTPILLLLPLRLRLRILHHGGQIIGRHPLGQVDEIGILLGGLPVATSRRGRDVALPAAGAAGRPLEAPPARDGLGDGVSFPAAGAVARPLEAPPAGDGFGGCGGGGVALPAAGVVAGPLEAPPTGGGGSVGVADLEVVGVGLRGGGNGGAAREGDKESAGDG
jgi:hypothetical protein